MKTFQLVASRFMKRAGLQESVRQFATDIKATSAKVDLGGKSLELTCSLQLPLIALVDLPSPIQKLVLKDLPRDSFKFLPIPMLESLVDSGRVRMSELPVIMLKKVPAAKLEVEGVDDDTLREIMEGMKHTDDLNEDSDFFSPLIESIGDELDAFCKKAKLAKDYSPYTGWGGASADLTIQIQNGNATVEWVCFGEFSGVIGPGVGKNKASFGSDVHFKATQWNKVKPHLITKNISFNDAKMIIYLGDCEPEDLIGFEIDGASAAWDFKVTAPLTNFDRAALIMLLRFFQGDESILT